MDNAIDVYQYTAIDASPVQIMTHAGRSMTAARTPVAKKRLTFQQYLSQEQTAFTLKYPFLTPWQIKGKILQKWKKLDLRVKRNGPVMKTYDKVVHSHLRENKTSALRRYHSQTDKENKVTSSNAISNEISLHGRLIFDFHDDSFNDTSRKVKWHKNVSDLKSKDDFASDVSWPRKNYGGMARMQTRIQHKLPVIISNESPNLPMSILKKSSSINKQTEVPVEMESSLLSCGDTEKTTVQRYSYTNMSFSDEPSCPTTESKDVDWILAKAERVTAIRDDLHSYLSGKHNEDKLNATCGKTNMLNCRDDISESTSDLYSNVSNESEEEQCLHLICRSEEDVARCEVLATEAGDDCHDVQELASSGQDVKKLKVPTNMNNSQISLKKPTDGKTDKPQELVMHERTTMNWIQDKDSEYLFNKLHDKEKVTPEMSQSLVLATLQQAYKQPKKAKRSEIVDKSPLPDLIKDSSGGNLKTARKRLDARKDDSNAQEQGHMLSPYGKRKYGRNNAHEWRRRISIRGRHVESKTVETTVSGSNKNKIELTTENVTGCFESDDCVSPDNGSNDQDGLQETLMCNDVRTYQEQVRRKFRTNLLECISQQIDTESDEYDGEGPDNESAAVVNQTIMHMRQVNNTAFSSELRDMDDNDSSVFSPHTNMSPALSGVEQLSDLLSVDGTKEDIGFFDINNDEHGRIRRVTETFDAIYSDCQSEINNKGKSSEETQKNESICYTMSPISDAPNSGNSLNQETSQLLDLFDEITPEKKKNTISAWTRRFIFSCQQNPNNASSTLLEQDSIFM